MVASAVCFAPMIKWNIFSDIPHTLAAGFSGVMFFHGNESMMLMLNYMRTVGKGLLQKRERNNFFPFNVDMSAFHLRGSAAFDVLAPATQFGSRALSPWALHPGSSEYTSVPLESAESVEGVITSMHDNLPEAHIESFTTIVAMSLEGYPCITAEASSCGEMKASLVLINVGTNPDDGPERSPSLSIIAEEATKSTSSVRLTDAANSEVDVNPVHLTTRTAGSHIEPDASPRSLAMRVKGIHCPAADEMEEPRTHPLEQVVECFVGLDSVKRTAVVVSPWLEGTGDHDPVAFLHAFLDKK